MHVFRGLPHPLMRLPSAIAIGNFDGVHLGHQALLRGVAQAAADRGLMPSVVTFEPHPREVLGGAEPLPRISTLCDKVTQILACGIERIYILPFNRRIAAQTAEEFVADTLINGLDARWVTVGEDFRFGSDRTGDVSRLAELGRQYGFETAPAPILLHAGVKVSSSRIREALAKGDLYEAGRMLGRRYAMSGRVIHGAELGRTLGYPTLNLAPILPGSHAKPAVTGVFAVKISGLGSAVRDGVASLGVKPTVTSAGRWLLETHVFDWKGNAYGRPITVYFFEKIRDEKKFSGLAELQAAIQHDADRARQILGHLPAETELIFPGI